MVAAGKVPTEITGLSTETHPIRLSVKIKVVVPALNAVTIPLLLIVATAGFVEVHVPPEEGKNEVVWPIQRVDNPVRLISGRA